MKNARVLAYAAAIACAALALAGCSDAGSPPSGGDPGPVSFTVDFDSQGGGSVASVKVLSGNTVDEPLNLTNAANEDLVFSGWYTEAACATRWDFEDPVAKDMKLYAKWNAANTLSFAAISGGAALEVGMGTGTLDADLYIPAYYKGKPVTSIADRGFMKTSLTNVVLSYGIKIIGQYAFNETLFSSVKLPSSLETLEYGAFYYSNLIGIRIPASVTTIEELALSCCAKMTQISIEEGNENFKIVDGVLFNMAGTILYQYPLGLPGTSYSISAGVTGIRGGAFYNTSLTEISIPEGVTEIRQNTFCGCRNLHSINIPASVASIGTRAFAHSFISTPSVIFIPETVTSMGVQEFWGCTNLSIRCQAPAKPSAWPDNWNQDVPNPVVWGCSS